jgi:hypothetical protein
MKNLSLPNTENLSIFFHRYTLRDGLKVQGTAIMNGQKATFRTHPLLERRLDFYCQATTNFIKSVTLTDEQYQDLLN